MNRVTGIGGIFFKSNDPEKLKAWYRDHFGIATGPDHGVVFDWREAKQPEQKGRTVWGSFPKETDYFDPSRVPFMINDRVANLDHLLEQLRLGTSKRIFLK